MAIGRIQAAVVVTGAILASAAPAAAAPDTSITSGPSGLTASRSASFRFSATVARATFQCKLDGKTWRECTPPARYSRLAQGAHTFQVRARKGRTVDHSPARRSFTVDTVGPNTAIVSGPTGTIEDHSPSFTFSSTEPGSFGCRLGTAGFTPCATPFAPPSPLPDGTYTFTVRARDAAGNVDKTPAARTFGIETPLTNTLETAQAAAALYFPDTIDLDVPASCSGNPTVDCPDGNALPPADQLRIASTRTVVEVTGANRYDVTVTSGVQTLQAIKVRYFGFDCDLTMTSANGTSPTWQVDMSFNFVVDPNSGEGRLVSQDPAVTGIESADYSLSGVNCALINFPTQSVLNIYLSALLAHFDAVGNPLCAAPGPAYLGPCPGP